MNTHTAKQGDTLDLIAFVYYAPEDDEAASQVLSALLAANPTLCNTPVLPVGTLVQLPPVELPQKETAEVSLWD